MNPEAPTRDYLPLEERRERLLDAALSVVAESGVAALSLRRVAERADVAHRVVTYAFGSKTALVEAVLHRASQRALDAVWAGDLPLDDFAESVRLSLHGLARDLRRHESEYRVVSELTASARAHPQLRAAAQSEIAASTRAIAESIERWSSMTGRALTTPTPVVAAALRASVDGLVEWWLSSHDERVLDDVVEVLASAFSGREADQERPHTAEEQGR
ncbi:TetR/AcrR family transcriptional regulator [Microbacterium testaceum]|uniref:TetR/AcrR family transcriptional regulator n=1 Tax=Microbacterium testaceum TaxID=2033 RepID=UPI0025B257FD|nr:TetR/AcrR family transcriptional regulator [Microbacterium testaceum]WJS90859.1 TetR/AcrR family transcriptional regulator [Microbacterium testaceum]